MINTQLRRLERLWSLCTYDHQGLFNYLRLRKTVVLPPNMKTIHLFHVRKTAGTSLFNAFLSLGGEDPRAVLRRIWQGYPWFAYSGAFTFANSYRANRIVPIRFSFSHKPFWSLNVSNTTYKITVLRDPVARVVSLYRYLSDARSDMAEAGPAPSHERDLTNEGFAAFIERLPKEDLLNQLYMFARDYSPKVAAENIRSFECYFFTEDFASGAEYLSSRLNIRLQVRHDRESKGIAPAVDVTELRRILKPEYDMLTELMTNPGPGFVGRFPASIID